jgi:hypothetical protein
MAEEKDISIEPPSSLESMDREDSQIPEKARGIRMEEKSRKTNTISTATRGDLHAQTTILRKYQDMWRARPMARGQNPRAWEGLGLVKSDPGHSIATLGPNSTPDRARFAPRTDELVRWGWGHARQGQWWPMVAMIPRDRAGCKDWGNADPRHVPISV